MSSIHLHSFKDASARHLSTLSCTNTFPTAINFLLQTPFRHVSHSLSVSCWCSLRKKNEIRQKKALALFASRSKLLCNILASLVVKNSAPRCLRECPYFLPGSWQTRYIRLGGYVALLHAKDTDHFTLPRRSGRRRLSHSGGRQRWSGELKEAGPMI